MSSDFSTKIFALNGEKKPVTDTPDGSSMSYSEGFDPLTSVSPADGGIPLERGQWNTLNYEITELLAEIQNYGCPLWCQTRQKPYPVGSLVSWVLGGISYQFRCLNPVNSGVMPGTNTDVWLNVTYFAPYPTSSADLQIGDILVSSFPEEFAISQHSNFLIPKGQKLSRTEDYRSLYSMALASGRVISQADWDADNSKKGYFGDGDGINTFCVPDLRGHFIRNSDETIAPFGLRQLSDNLTHSHWSNASLINADTEGTEGTDGKKIISYRQAGNTGVSGGSEARPINVAYTFLMKYK